MSALRVVVTGGAGFIGANLCRALSALADPPSVVALDDLSTGSRQNLADQPAVELVEGSILDTALLDSVVGGADAVVHLAARPSVPRSLADPLASHSVNATGTVMVLEAARRAGSSAGGSAGSSPGGLARSPLVIVASSSSVYGANPALPKREDLVPMPVSPYAVSKLATESYALAWASSFGLPVLAFRFFNVFGPLQSAGHAYAAVIPTFIDAALAGRPLPVHGDGRQTRDFTYVGSVVGVLADAVARRVTSDRPVNLAFGSRVSLLALIASLEEVLGHPVEVAHSAPRAGDVRDSQADQSRLRELFPDVVPVSLRDGLEATVRWFESR